MLNEQQLAQFFKLKHLPIKDGEFWDGKPNNYSNLKQWALTPTQKYGQNLLNYAQFGLKGHNGVDIAFKEGCPIVAPCRLYMSYIQIDPKGYGNAVWAETETQQINGDSYKLEMAFGHFKEIVAKPFKWYNEGDLLGYGDSTGFSTGDHLHYGTRPHCKLGNQDWRQMFPDNGFKGWIDPQQFLPHIVWNLEELLTKNYMTEFKEKHDGKLIFNNDTGEIGWFYGDKLRIPPDTDKFVKMIASYLVRKEGAHISDVEWDKLDKIDF